jgi:hypothetical protein
MYLNTRYLNTRSPHLNSIGELRATDKIAVTAVRVSVPAIIMQMAASRDFGTTDYAHCDNYRDGLTHAHALIALSSGRANIWAHSASLPFHQRKRKADVRTIMTSDPVMGGPSTHHALHADQVRPGQSQGLRRRSTIRTCATALPREYDEVRQLHGHHRQHQAALARWQDLFFSDIHAMPGS